MPNDPKYIRELIVSDAALDQLWSEAGAMFSAGKLDFMRALASRATADELWQSFDTVERERLLFVSVIAFRELMMRELAREA